MSQYPKLPDPTLQDQTVRTALVLGSLVLVLAGVYAASPILAPMAFALVMIATVWPIQSVLQERMPKLLALAVTTIIALAVVAALIYLLAWAFGLVVQWLINNTVRFQSIYDQAIEWFEQHGVSIKNLMIESYDPSWLIGLLRDIGGRSYRVASFTAIAFAFVVLGLLEVDVLQRNIQKLDDERFKRSLLKVGQHTAEKFQKYMLVRTVMSVLTGIIVWSFALVAGIELATAWGVIAFVFNYVPFIGPLFATVFPTLFALVQVGSWELAIFVFVCLNVIQFVTGSYIEPRIAGATLSISPFVVLFAVFFWSLLWGIPGAFIGVPIAIAILTICEEYESTRWIATLLSGRDSGVA
jgi:AI-2 transport protein TqsA